jgi:hypothetical protein
MQEFVNAVRTGEPPETVARDNIRSLAAVNGWVMSIERGEPVDVIALLGSA